MTIRYERPRCPDCASDDPARFVFCPSVPDKCEGCEVCDQGHLHTYHDREDYIDLLMQRAAAAEKEIGNGG